MRGSIQSAECESAYNYLRERKFTDETLDSFRVGYAPRDFTFEATERELDILEALDYISRNPDGSLHHNYENRIMFPACDPQGHVRGFSGRRIGEATSIKYYNSAESELFRKGRLLFGFEKARRGIYLNNKAIICEGFTDVLAYHQVGAKIAVACMGVALTEWHMLELSRYTDTLMFAFDADKGGNNALKKSIELAKLFGMKYGVQKFPDGKDPAAYLLGGDN